MTYYEAALRAHAALIGAGIRHETARLDAELLARDAAGWDLAAWLSRRSDPAPPEFIDRFQQAIDRRLNREPVAYIRGVQEFWGREFRVTPAALIPRSETELLVEAAGEFLHAHPRARVADVGTGSGCIAITLALDHPAATVYAVDISAPALALARENAARLDAADRVQFIEGAYLASVPRPVDLIVSNPPYIAGSDAPGLAPEVRDHEPAVALFGGDDGWQAIRTLLEEAVAALTTGGRLMIEIGYRQIEQLGEVIDDAPGLALDRVCEDLQGIPRVAVIRRAA